MKASYVYSHFELLALTLEETLAAMLPRTVIVHVKDARGGEAKHDFLLPGDGGAIDYADYFGRLGAPAAGTSRRSRPRGSAGEIGQRPGRSSIRHEPR